ncbi:sugar phosphate isomerase/epimerase family protein [Nanoarchaeota archaeon]
MRKVGIKTYPDKKEYFEKIRGHCDAIELMAAPDIDIDFYSKFEQKFFLHAPHCHFGVNLANPEREEFSIKMMKHAIKVADALNAEFIVVHAGYEETPKSTLKQACKVLKEVWDERMLIENEPGWIEPDIRNHAFCKVEETKEIMEETGLGMCLDIAHAACSAALQGADHVEYNKRFMELKPKYFHFCDGIVGQPYDSHLHFGKGNLDLNKIKAMVPEDLWVTIETWHDFEEQLSDIEFLKA